MRGLFAKMKRQTTQHNKSTERIILQYYYSATSTNMKLVHWSLMGGLLHLVQRGGT